MASTILEFWKAHPQYWIAGKHEKEADGLITSLYFKQNADDLPWLDAVIYLDQFMRHFSRVPSTEVTEKDVRAARVRAADLVLAREEELPGLAEDELMFALMPLKHMGYYEKAFAFMHKWLPSGESFQTYTLMHRFYTDTYSKAYGGRSAYVPPQVPMKPGGDWSKEICEECPPRPWGTGELPARALEMIEYLRDASVEGKLWVSLSGGIDSNVMCALGRRAGLEVHAVHIIYGNRIVSENEAAFVADLCDDLGVTLHTYRIPWLRRGLCDRAFYESASRDLRFACYRAALGGAATAGICLGHIQEDVVENVWTNFAHGAHLDNLAKMSVAEMEDGVVVRRPWLKVSKADVYMVASGLHIPHLKNTTPSWSNRGKFRTAFYPATHAQYTESVDKKVLEVAEALRVQASMLEKLLYKPVFDSWCDGYVDVSPIFHAGGLDGNGWLRVLTHFCHTHLGISKPSIHACRDLAQRLEKPFTTMKIIMKKDLTLHFKQDNNKFIMILVH